METVNLKIALTVQAVLNGTVNSCAPLDVKVFRGSIVKQGNPEGFKSTDRVRFKVCEIRNDDSETLPWFKLVRPVTLDVVWSNVLSVQQQ